MGSPKIKMRMVTQTLFFPIRTAKPRRLAEKEYQNVLIPRFPPLLRRLWPDEGARFAAKQALLPKNSEIC